jgi:hypothetical protein
MEPVAESMTRSSPIELATQLGGKTVVLAQTARRDWQQRWREQYACAVKAGTGKWIYNRFDWHAFSWNFTRAVHGEKALMRYLRELDTSLIVIPNRVAPERVDGAVRFFACDAQA